MTTTIIAAVAAALLGGLLAWLLAAGQKQAALARAAAAEGQLAPLTAQLEALRLDRDAARQQCTVAETRLEELGKNLEAQKASFEQAQALLEGSFKALASDALHTNNAAFMELAKSQLETLMAAAQGDLGQRQQAVAGLVEPLQAQLKRYEEQIGALEAARQTAYGSLERQLQDLNRETDSLVRALRSPQVRGAWGELTLRNTVELAGLSEHCDFEEQVSINTDDGRLRPDLVVHLPGDRCIVVDAKVPLEAYMEALQAPDEATRAAAMQRHADHVRAHVKALQSKQYAREFRNSPDFVLLFLSGESFFSAALEQDQQLYEYALRSGVLLCSPTSLVAHLRTVAMIWHQHEFLENATAIAECSQELFNRLSVFVGHFGRIGKGLQDAENAYNSAVGSYQSRILPQGRKVVELGGAARQAELAELDPVQVVLRELPATAGEEEVSG
ncbi:MAG TPA: DNA recombination protein RmuC [Armatimonadota bacterium]|jgi:DNA recombination protein RmuC